MKISSSNLKAFTKNPKRTTNDADGVSRHRFAMWVKAVERLSPVSRQVDRRSGPASEATEPDSFCTSRKRINGLADPPHHQSGVHGEVMGDGQFTWLGRPRPGRRDCLVELPAGLEVPGSRLGVTLTCCNYNKVSQESAAARHKSAACHKLRTRSLRATKRGGTVRGACSAVPLSPRGTFALHCLSYGLAVCLLAFIFLPRDAAQVHAAKP